MSHQETNPYFLQQQPLLRSDPAPRHPERDHHTPPGQRKDHEPPLARWAPPSQHPLHSTELEPAPILKKQKRSRKDSKPSGTVVSPPPPQPPDHRSILPHVPGKEEQEQRPPSGSPANQQAPPARQKHNIPPENRTTPQFLPKDRRTKLPTWFAAVFCAIFWIVIILGGLVVLIVYLVFRPKSPWFDVANVNLNAAYLDMGYLLNADLILLVNFTNPNHKVSVDFSSMYLDLYFENTMIATQYVQPFSAPRSKSMLATIHMMSSQVPLAIKESLQLQQQIQNSSVTFDLKGKFRARSNFGSLIRYSYWLHGLCRVIVSSPPTGVLKGKKCITKQ